MHLEFNSQLSRALLSGSIHALVMCHAVMHMYVVVDCPVESKPCTRNFATLTSQSSDRLSLRLPNICRLLQCEANMRHRSLGQV